LNTGILQPHWRGTVPAIAIATRGRGGRRICSFGGGAV